MRASGRNDPFDVEEFLAQPLVARVATAGPTVRPIWFLWEDGAFWWITGSYARLPELLAEDPRVALVVDTCDLSTFEILQVTAHGEAELAPFDAARARRKLRRYLGPDEASWHSTFRELDFDEPRFVRLAPSRLTAKDLSFPTPEAVNPSRQLHRPGRRHWGADGAYSDVDGSGGARVGLAHGARGEGKARH